MTNSVSFDCCGLHHKHHTWQFFWVNHPQECMHRLPCLSLLISLFAFRYTVACTRHSYCYDRNTGYNWPDQTLEHLKRLRFSKVSSPVSHDRCSYCNSLYQLVPCLPWSGLWTNDIHLLSVQLFSSLRLLSTQQIISGCGSSVQDVTLAEETIVNMSGIRELFCDCLWGWTDFSSRMTTSNCSCQLCVTLPLSTMVGIVESMPRDRIYANIKA